ncbi:unnamed protein product, partial [Ectocarpus sp. 12 AP-2014]
AYDEAVAAGKHVVRVVKQGLVDRFPAVELMANVRVFDPQHFPLSLQEARAYRETDVKNLADHYGNGYTNGQRLVKEWVGLKPTMLKARKKEEIAKLVADLEEVHSDAGRPPAENVFKLVKLYITLPHSCVESERGFSCQNRIKSKSRTL